MRTPIVARTATFMADAPGQRHDKATGRYVSKGAGGAAKAVPKKATGVKRGGNVNVTKKAAAPAKETGRAAPKPKHEGEFPGWEDRGAGQTFIFRRSEHLVGHVAERNSHVRQIAKDRGESDKPYLAKVWTKRGVDTVHESAHDTASQAVKAAEKAMHAWEKTNAGGLKAAGTPGGAMPWEIVKRGGKSCVVKQGEDSPVPGGCHPNPVEAKKHLAALYASEKGSAGAAAQVEAFQRREFAQVHGKGGRFVSHGAGRGETKSGVPTIQTDKGGHITRADAAGKMFGKGSPQHKKALEMDRKAAAKKAGPPKMPAKPVTKGAGGDKAARKHDIEVEKASKKRRDSVFNNPKSRYRSNAMEGTEEFEQRHGKDGKFVGGGSSGGGGKGGGDKGGGVDHGPPPAKSKIQQKREASKALKERKEKGAEMLAGEAKGPGWTTKSPGHHEVTSPDGKTKAAVTHDKNKGDFVVHRLVPGERGVPGRVTTHGSAKEAVSAANRFVGRGPVRPRRKG